MGAVAVVVSRQLDDFHITGGLEFLEAMSVPMLDPIRRRPQHRAIFSGLPRPRLDDVLVVVHEQTGKKAFPRAFAAEDEQSYVADGLSVERGTRERSG